MIATTHLTLYVSASTEHVIVFYFFTYVRLNTLFFNNINRRQPYPFYIEHTDNSILPTNIHFYQTSWNDSLSSEPS